MLEDQYHAIMLSVERTSEVFNERLIIFKVEEMSL